MMNKSDFIVDILIRNNIIYYEKYILKIQQEILIIINFSPLPVLKMQYVISQKLK